MLSSLVRARRVYPPASVWRNLVSSIIIPLNICIIDKGEEIGAQILSGAVLEPRALNELIPDWQNREPPLHTPVTQDQFLFLTEKKSWRLPTPPQMHNHGNYIISLGQFCAGLPNKLNNWV